MSNAHSTRQKKEPKAIVGGGWKAIATVWRYAGQMGYGNLLRTLTSKNTCKACAFGTGGQNGGLHNETRRGIEICNKNVQAHLSDMRGAIAPNFFFEKSIAEMRAMSAQELEALGRLTTPVYKKPGASHYSAISYDEALRICSERLQATAPQRSFFYASGRSSNEAAFLLQTFARLYGTNNVNNCSFYCHQASGVGLTATLGTGTATVQYDDLDKADVIFVFGANPASNHPRYLKALMKCRRRGGKVVVVNPAREPGMVKFASPSDWRSMLKGGEEIASHYLQPHLGGDIALMQGMAKCLLAKNLENADFIQQHTEGFEVFAKEIDELAWEKVEQSSGLFREQIEEVAELYSNGEKVIFSWSMGLTHHTHGVANIETLVALALLRGMVGRPGTGLLPLRGHSNIQGVGSMGFTPELKKGVEQNLEKKIGAALPTAAGLDTMACIEASARGDMDVAVLLGGNLLASNPDRDYAIAALNKIGFKAYINSTLNIGHVHAVDGEVLILPVRARDEEQQATTQESMFNFVRKSDGGINRLPQLRSEVDIIQTIGEQVIAKTLCDFSVFRSHEKIREWIGDVVPGFTKIQQIDESNDEFYIEGRTLHQPKFATATGLALFKYHPLPPRPFSGVWRNHDGNHEFMLTSVRSEGQFNSIIYHEEDHYRGQTDRWVVLMHPQDMAICGYADNVKVTIRTDTGEMRDLKVRPFDVRRGNIMVYYPEANVLIPKNLDSESKTPAFKSVAVEVI